MRRRRKTLRIKSIDLNNFRCFKHQTIDLSSDLVAIYGRNGVGKTSVFDAIEFALLGNIGRFEGEKTFEFLANVFSEEAASVSLAIDDGNFINVIQPREEGSRPQLSACEDIGEYRDLHYDYLINGDYVSARREVAIVEDL